jgi:hypothetical protein
MPNTTGETINSRQTDPVKEIQTSERPAPIVVRICLSVVEKPLVTQLPNIIASKALDKRGKPSYT